MRVLNSFPTRQSSDLFVNFDAHKETLVEAWKDVIVIVNELLESNIMFKRYFSGKGFHIIILGERVNDMRSIQSTFTQLAKNSHTLDNTGIQKIGRAHVSPVTRPDLVCRLLLEKKKK